MGTRIGKNAKSVLLPLQIALFARMSDGMDVPVYDYVPENAPHPFVTIGEGTERPDNNHSNFGRDCTLVFHIWVKSREGFAPAMSICDQLQELLDHQEDLVVEGHRVVSIRLDQVLTMRDPDPEIRHIPMRFRIKTAQD